MPVPLVAYGLDLGPKGIPYVWTIIKSLAAGFVLWVLKTYFGGARNTAERNMHSKVVMITVSACGKNIRYFTEADAHRVERLA